MKWILFILGVIKFFILVPLTIVVIIPYFITIFFLTILGYFWKEFGSEIQEWRKKYGKNIGSNIGSVDAGKYRCENNDNAETTDNKG